MMDKQERSALTAALCNVVREYVVKTEEKLSQWVSGELKALTELFDERIRSLPEPRQGERGEKGEKGDPGEQGEVGPAGESIKGECGERGTSGERGEKGEKGDKGDPGEAGIGTVGPPGERGTKGDPGERGEKGERGEAGESIKGDKGDPGERGERGEVGEKGESGPIGLRGETGERGLPGEKGDKGEPGVHGERGEKGEPGSKGDIGERGLPGERGERGEPGPRGERGERGEHGRDALQFDILSAIDTSKSYPRGTFATHRGGLCWAWKTTIPSDDFVNSGWQVITNGIADEQPIDSDDPREFGYVRTFTDGRKRIVNRRMDVPLFQGIWKVGSDYVKSDIVQRDGSMWYCNVSGTKAGPGNGTTDWTLCTKHGRDGKDGKNGERGLQGPEGPRGRDLTQVDYSTGAKH